MALKSTAEKLKEVRELIALQNLSGYFIPKANAFQCEYLRPEEERLKWLTGFSGSAGIGLVTRDQAYLFVDGRYRLQALQEVDGSLFEIIDTTFMPFGRWLRTKAPLNCIFGFDPWLVTERQLGQYEQALQERQGKFCEIAENFIDKIWSDRPASPIKPCTSHPLAVAGQSVSDKLQQVAQRLLEKGADSALMTTAESVNWLLNIRGQDLDHVPVVFGYCIVDSQGQGLFFTDLRKITSPLIESWQDQVTVCSQEDFVAFLQDTGAQKKRMLMDPAEVPVKAHQIFKAAGGHPVMAENPTLLPKACKNAVELAGMEATHQRDGAALTMFLRWVHQESLACNATELSAAQKLHELRAQLPTFRGESFPTISAVAAHGAIVHYRATPETDLAFQANDIYLVDSGAHYHDGSTDVTRTVVLGVPTPEQKESFTRVLKGHIALATIVFPAGTTGSQLDVLARQFLWQQGEDYHHGTGHGVGSVLNIHEGPQSISKNPSLVPLQPGMILSNEPGYYKDNAYGIRIESLVVVEPRILRGNPMLGFKTLTLAPLDRALIDISLLSPPEIDWINQYHARVYEILNPRVDPATQDWLTQVTRPF